VEPLSRIIERLRPLEVLHFRESRVGNVIAHPSDWRIPQTLFVCMDEFLEYNVWQTWRTHLERLGKLDLAAVVVPEPIEGWGIPQLVVETPRRALGQIAALLHQADVAPLRLAGITGTNGKTTTVRLVAHMTTELGMACGSVGTLGTSLEKRIHEPGTYTTPLASMLYRDLGRLGKAGAKAVALEVSSHALALDRVEGLLFDAAVLTNVGRDHLDFHGTETAYAEAKSRLFGLTGRDGVSILNRHSAYCEAFAEVSRGRVVTYGLEGSGADVICSEMQLSATHSCFQVSSEGKTASFRTRLVGPFQVENCLAAITLMLAWGFTLEAIADVLPSFEPVCGRMEQIPLPNGCIGIVDYAHNPAGLEQLLVACRRFCKGRLHLVFGCGGDRDRGKRPLMAAIAERHADICWITSDNPRTEDPLAIIEEIRKGFTGTEKNPCIEPDRASAIQSAYRGTELNDLLVVAGKGHEDYQLIGHEKHPFSDQDTLRRLGNPPG